MNFLCFPDEGFSVLAPPVTHLFILLAFLQGLRFDCFGNLLVLINMRSG